MPRRWWEYLFGVIADAVRQAQDRREAKEHSSRCQIDAFAAKYDARPRYRWSNGFRGWVRVPSPRDWHYVAVASLL